MKYTLKQIIIRPVKALLNEYSLMRLHGYHEKMALKALNVIEKQNGKLNVRYKRTADIYSQEVFGDKRYAPWLYVYSALRGSFVEGWIPGNYYVLVLTPRINGKCSDLDSMRTLTNRILNTDSIPDNSYLINGILYSRKFKPVYEGGELQHIFNNEEVVYFKNNDSAQGKGVIRIKKQDFSYKNFDRSKDGCFQSNIDPHEFFTQITKRSTSTIRITTIRDNSGRISARASYLRVGRDTDDIVRSSSAVKIPVDIYSGILYDHGYMPDWSRTENHPDSDFRFSGKEIPYFHDAKRHMIELHESFPHFSIIGWDYCIDRNDRIRIMEWNAHQTGIVFSEATTGPCFADLGWENIWKKSV